jgi:endogenous inhibitor of DNA gyrase (YacG/DUF329 family)
MRPLVASRFMKCPTCGKPVEWKDNPFRPFCSERCQLVDLGRWVEGEYRVPGEPLPQEQNEVSADEDEAKKHVSRKDAKTQRKTQSRARSLRLPYTFAPLREKSFVFLSVIHGLQQHETNTTSTPSHLQSTTGTTYPMPPTESCVTRNMGWELV